MGATTRNQRMGRKSGYNLHAAKILCLVAPILLHICRVHVQARSLRSDNQIGCCEDGSALLPSYDKLQKDTKGGGTKQEVKYSFKHVCAVLVLQLLSIFASL